MVAFTPGVVGQMLADMDRIWREMDTAVHFTSPVRTIEVTRDSIRVLPNLRAPITACYCPEAQ